MALTKAQKDYLNNDTREGTLSQLAKDTGLTKDEVKAYLDKITKTDTKTSTEAKPTQVQSMMDNAFIKKPRHGVVISTEASSQISDATKRVTRNSSMNRFIHKPKGDNKSK